MPLPAGEEFGDGEKRSRSDEIPTIAHPRSHEGIPDLFAGHHIDVEIADGESPLAPQIAKCKIESVKKAPVDEVVPLGDLHRTLWNPLKGRNMRSKADGKRR